MAKLPILQYPHPKLAAKAEPVADFNDAIKTLVNDMAETMYAAPGVGLAANQVGILKRIVVIDITDDNSDLLVFINPEIIETKGDLVDHEEGCLSLKGLYEHVKRPGQVRVHAQNIKGETFELECTGLLAVCIQHEVDHLNGIVFIDHLSQLKKQRACTKLRKLRREDREREKDKEKEHVKYLRIKPGVHDNARRSTGHRIPSTLVQADDPNHLQRSASRRE